MLVLGVMGAAALGVFVCWVVFSLIAMHYPAPVMSIKRFFRP